MSTPVELITMQLHKTLQPDHVEVIDEGHLHAKHEHADAGHFRINIVASCFIGKSRIDCHRMVYNALQDPLGFGMHALAIRTATPQEYAQPLT